MFILVLLSLKHKVLYRNNKFTHNNLFDGSHTLYIKSSLDLIIKMTPD